MAEQTRQKTTSKTGTATLEFDEFELNSTMQDFLQEEEKDTGKGIWNIATIAGMAMLFMGLTFVLQWIGIPIGEGFANFVSDAIVALPLIGGILITLIGFGFFVGDRKKARKYKKEQKKKQKQNQSRSKASDQFFDVHGSEDFSDFTSSSSGSGLNNDLDSDSKSRSGSKSRSNSSFKSQSDAFGFDSYGYRHTKRLMKSRSDKKWAGVCGGLAKYFGISSTVVRFIFVAAFFMGYGASLLIYFGLALAMPKEPIEMMDDFDF